MHRLVRESLSTFTSYSLQISTLILKLENIIFCDLQLVTE